MENKEIWKNAQPWERKLAESMCSVNINILKEQLYTSDIEQFNRAKERMINNAVAVIREVPADSNGLPILSPQEWMDKTRGMDENEMKSFQAPIMGSVQDVRIESVIQVPASLTDNIRKLIDVGIRHMNALSGRIIDQPNFRDMNGFPFAFSALARPVSMLTFDLNHRPGNRSSINRSQLEDITAAAQETGWIVENRRNKRLSLNLPITRTGKSVEQLLKVAKEMIHEQNPLWRESNDWKDILRKSFNDTIRKEGGRIIYTDREIADAWDRLTQAIVQKTRLRQESEYSRLSDIQIGRKVDKEKQVVIHSIRCRIDGKLQTAVPLHALDGGIYDTAAYLNDEHKLVELKKELAATYFSDELREECKENRGMKR